MSKQDRKLDDDRDHREQRIPRVEPQQISDDDEGRYVTELDYISTWDAIHSEPSDVYANGLEQMFEQGAFYPGEEYPRGV